MVLSRWLGWARDMVRLVRGLPDEEIRQKTLAIHEQLVRLRRHRAAYEKEREVAALRDVRRVVEEMQGLEKNLNEAEKATAEYVDTLAKQVTKEMEAKLNAEMDMIMKKAVSRENEDLQQLSSKSVASPSESK